VVIVFLNKNSDFSAEIICPLPNEDVEYHRSLTAFFPIPQFFTVKYRAFQSAFALYPNPLKELNQI
jgi:hypothetical protein